MAASVADTKASATMAAPGTPPLLVLCTARGKYPARATFLAKRPVANKVALMALLVKNAAATETKILPTCPAAAWPASAKAISFLSTNVCAPT